MAAIVNIPFNFQPVTSPSRKTSSYTVPANRYAKAIIGFHTPRNFSMSGQGVSQSQTLQYITINGVNVLSERSFALYLQCQTGQNQTYSGTFSISGFTGLLQGFLTGGVYSFAGVSSTGPTTPIGGLGYCNARFAGAVTISCTQVGNAQFSGTLTNYALPETIEVWLKPGDVLNATGGNWQAIVTEYAIPS